MPVLNKVMPEQTKKVWLGQIEKFALYREDTGKNLDKKKWAFQNKFRKKRWKWKSFQIEIYTQ